MDDERTPHNPTPPARGQAPTTAPRATLDELADLFLTGTTGPAPAIPPKALPPRRDPLAGPAPFKLAPKPAVRNPSPAHNTPSQIEEGRADTARLANAARASTAAPPLRYTGASDGLDEIDELDPRPEREALLPSRPTPLVPPVTSVPIQPPMVEAVLLGNLPGLAGAWLTQYAQLLAQQDGPVAVLYLDPVGDEGEGRVDVELVEPSIHSAAVGNPVRLPPAGPTRLRDTIEALCRKSDGPVRTVLVHADAEPAVFELLADVPSWTLLTGADPMAVRAAEATFQKLIDSAGPVPPALGVVVMGSEQPQAEQAAERLREALPEPVSLLGYLKKLMPVAVRSVGEFPGLATQWEHLSGWLAEQGVEVEAAEALEEAIAPLPAPEPVVIQKQPALPPRVRPSPRLNPALPQALAKPLEPTPEQIPEPAPAPTSKQAPESTAEPTPTLSALPGAKRLAVPDLLALLANTPAAINHPIALQARCPAQPNTQLVLDGSGRLHLLGVHHHRDDPEQSRSVQEAVQRLMDAAHWALEHRDLLALTLRDQPFDRERTPALHLFTDRADLAVAMLTRPGPSLNLHLLQQVTVHDQSTWLCVPLNRAG